MRGLLWKSRDYFLAFFLATFFLGAAFLAGFLAFFLAGIEENKKIKTGKEIVCISIFLSHHCIFPKIIFVRKNITTNNNS